MVTWDLRRAGHAWGAEAMSRYEMTPEKTEMVARRLYGTDEERLTMLALLLEMLAPTKRYASAIDTFGVPPSTDCDEGEGQEHESSAPLLPEPERRALEAALVSHCTRAARGSQTASRCVIPPLGVGGSCLPLPSSKLQSLPASAADRYHRSAA